MKLACGELLSQHSRTMVLEHLVLGIVKLIMNEENVYNQANAKGGGGGGPEELGGRTDFKVDQNPNCDSARFTKASNIKVQRLARIPQTACG